MIGQFRLPIASGHYAYVSQGGFHQIGGTRNCAKGRQMQLLVAHDTLDEAVVVRVEGEIDSSNAEEFASHLAAALGLAGDHPARLLVVDLQRVSFFGSAGLNAVLACHEKGAADGTAVRLVAAQPEVVCPVEVTKLDSVLQLYPSFAEAIAPRSRP